MSLRTRLSAALVIVAALCLGAFAITPTFSSWSDATSNTGSTITAGSDWIAPIVVSIDRADANPTGASTVRWTVTFSETVTGVSATDFALARTGDLTGGTVSALTGSGTTYTVTASSGAGAGTLALNLVDDDSIADASANKLGGTGATNGNFSGQTYTLDRTGPALTDVTILDADGDGRIDRVRADFDESLASSTTTAPWTLTNVPSGGTIASVSTSGTSATINLTEGTGAADTTVGTMNIALAASATGVRDALGNQASFAARAPDDGAAPAMFDTAIGDADANGKIDYALASFSEPLAGSNATAPWTLANVPSGGTISGVIISGVLAGLLITEGSGAANTAAGSMTIALAASASGIRDPAGNQASFAADVPLDIAAPVKTAVEMFDVDADGKIDRVTTTFSEALASSTATSPWTLSGVPSAGSLSAVSTSGSAATVSISEGGGSADTSVGTFTIALDDSSSGIRDATGNESSFSAAEPADEAGPVPVTVSDTDGTTNGRLQTANTFVVTFSEAIASGLPSSTPITEARASTGNAKLTITGFTNGALDMGSTSYVLSASTSVVFAGTSARTNSNKTVTITAGTCSSSCASAATGTGTTMIYVPASTLLDAAGNGATGSRPTGFRIF